MAGVHRICLTANRALFADNQGLKYECSIEIDSLFEKMYEEKAEGLVTR